MTETTILSTNLENPLSDDELHDIDAYWRAANYLSVGQIYLLDNPLLREPLRLQHIKPRLLGHWGTTPGLNLIYVHLNRVIKVRDLDVLFVTGPGHGARSRHRLHQVGSLERGRRPGRDDRALREGARAQVVARGRSGAAERQLPAACMSCA